MRRGRFFLVLVAVFASVCSGCVMGLWCGCAQVSGGEVSGGALPQPHTQSTGPQKPHSPSPAQARCPLSHTSPDMNTMVPGLVPGVMPDSLSVSSPVLAHL